MPYLVDTNVCSEYLRRGGKVFHRFLQHSGRLYMSVVTFSELTAWAYKQKDPSRIQAKVAELIEIVPVLPFDLKAAEIAGRIRGQHLRIGISFSPSDLMIASTAIAYDLTLVTHNVSDFQRVPGLHIEDWLE